MIDFMLVNGRRIDPTAPAIAASDAAFQLGEGAFETMTVRDRAILRADRHRARLATGCRLLDLPPVDWTAVEAAVAGYCGETGADDAALRVTVSRGPLQGAFGSPAIGPPTVAIRLRPRPTAAPPTRAAVIDWPRRATGGLATRFKAIGYANELAARRAALACGADIALMLAPDGAVACADCANLFVKQDGVWHTPPESDGALLGTVRGWILESADPVLDAPAIEGRVFPADLAAAEAILLTNAGWPIAPVRLVAPKPV